MADIDNTTSRVDVELNAKDNASGVIESFSNALQNAFSKISKLNTQLNQVSKNNEKFSKDIYDLIKSERVIDGLSSKLQILEKLLKSSTQKYNLQFTVGHSISDIKEVEAEILKLKSILKSLMGEKGTASASLSVITDELKLVGSELGKQINLLHGKKETRRNKDVLSETEIRKLSKKQFSDFKANLLKGFGDNNDDDRIKYVYKLLEKLGNSPENIQNGILKTKNQAALLSSILYHRSNNINNSDIENYNQKLYARASSPNAYFNEIDLDKKLIKSLITNYLSSLFYERDFTSGTISASDSQKIIANATNRNSALNYAGLEIATKSSSNRESSNYISNFIKSGFPVKKIENLDEIKPSVEEIADFITSLKDSAQEKIELVRDKISEASEKLNANSVINNKISEQTTEPIIVKKENISINHKPIENKDNISELNAKSDNETSKLVESYLQSITQSKADSLENYLLNNSGYQSLLTGSNLLDSITKGLNSNSVIKDWNPRKLKNISSDIDIEEISKQFYALSESTNKTTENIKKLQEIASLGIGFSKTGKEFEDISKINDEFVQKIKDIQKLRQDFVTSINQYSLSKTMESNDPYSSMDVIRKQLEMNKKRDVYKTEFQNFHFTNDNLNKNIDALYDDLYKKVSSYFIKNNIDIIDNNKGLKDTPSIIDDTLIDEDELESLFEEAEKRRQEEEQRQKEELADKREAIELAKLDAIEAKRKKKFKPTEVNLQKNKGYQDLLQRNDILSLIGDNLTGDENFNGLKFPKGLDSKENYFEKLAAEAKNANDEVKKLLAISSQGLGLSKTGDELNSVVVALDNYALKLNNLKELYHNYAEQIKIYSKDSSSANKTAVINASNAISNIDIAKFNTNLNSTLQKAYSDIEQQLAAQVNNLSGTKKIHVEEILSNGISSKDAENYIAPYLKDSKTGKKSQRLINRLDNFSADTWKKWEKATKNIDNAEGISNLDKKSLKEYGQKVYSSFLKMVYENVSRNLESLKLSNKFADKDIFAKVDEWEKELNKKFDLQKLLDGNKMSAFSSPSGNDNYYNDKDREIIHYIEETEDALKEIKAELNQYTRDATGKLQYNGKTLSDDTAGERLRRDYDSLLEKKAYYSERIRGSKETLERRIYERENPTGWNRFGHDFLGALYFSLSSREANSRQRGGMAGFLGTMGHALSGNIYKEGEVQKRLLPWRPSIVHHAGDRKGWFSNVFGDVGGKNLFMGGAVFAMFGSALENATKSLGMFSKEAMEAFGSIQSIKTNLEVVFGNQTQSDAMFQKLSDYAVKSPFGVEQTSEQAVLLRQSGIYSSDLLDTMKRIGDVAGGNVVKMEHIAANYAKIVSMGNANMMNMRQFAYAGLPIYAEVAKELKVSQGTLRSMIKDGQVTADVIQKVFQNMTNEGGTFYGAVDKGAKTYQARKMNLMDSRTLAASSIGQFYYTLGAKTDSNQGFLSRFLDLKEGVYNGLQQWFNASDLKQTIKIGKSATESAEYKKLQKLRATRDEIKTLSDDKNSPVLKAIEKQIKELENSLISYDAIINAKAAFTEQYDANKDKKKFTPLGILIGGGAGLASAFGIGKLAAVIAAGGGVLAGLSGVAVGVAAIATSIASLVTIATGILTLVQSRGDKKVAEEGRWAIAQRDVTSYLASANDTVSKIIDNQGDSKGFKQGSSFTMISNARENVEKGELESLRRNDRIHFNNVDRYNTLSGLDKKYRQADGSYIFDDVKMSAKQLAKSMELLAQSVDNLGLNVNDYYIGLDKDSNGGKLSLDGKKNLEILKNNFDRIKDLNFDTIKNGKEIEKYWNSVKNTLADYNKSLNNSEDFKDFLEKISTLTNLVMASGDKDLEKILAFTMTKSVFSTEDKDKLVERTKAPVWAKVLANNSGMNASRIYLEGSRHSMDIYEQRNSRDAYANLSKSLLSMGYNLRDIRDNTRKSGLRNEKGQINWNENWKILSESISGKKGSEAIEERDALISVYESLVNKIDELEINGITTEDDADMLYSLAQALGPAFDWATNSVEFFAENVTRIAEELKVKYSDELRTLRIETNKDRFNKKYEDAAAKNRQYGAFAGYNFTADNHVYTITDDMIDNLISSTDKAIEEIFTDRYSAKKANELGQAFLDNGLIDSYKKIDETAINPKIVQHRKGDYINNDRESENIRNRNNNKNALLNRIETKGLSLDEAFKLFKGENLSQGNYSINFGNIGLPFSTDSSKWKNSLVSITDGIGGESGVITSERAKIIKDSTNKLARLYSDIRKKNPEANNLYGASQIQYNILDNLKNASGINASEIYLQIKKNKDFQDIYGDEVSKVGGSSASIEKQNEAFKKAFDIYMEQMFEDLLTKGFSSKTFPIVGKGTSGINFDYQKKAETYAMEFIENDKIQGIEKANEKYSKDITTGGETLTLAADEKTKKNIEEAAKAAFRSGDIKKIIELLQILEVTDENKFNELIKVFADSEKERQLKETAVNAGADIRGKLGYGRVTDYGFETKGLSEQQVANELYKQKKDDDVYKRFYDNFSKAKLAPLEERYNNIVTKLNEENELNPNNSDGLFILAKQAELLSIEIKELKEAIKNGTDEDIKLGAKEAYDDAGPKKQVDETDSGTALKNMLWRDNVGGNSVSEAYQMKQLGFNPNTQLYDKAAIEFKEKNGEQEWYKNFENDARSELERKNNKEINKAIENGAGKTEISDILARQSSTFESDLTKGTFEKAAEFEDLLNTLDDLKEKSTEAFNTTVIQAWNGGIKETTKNLAKVAKGLQDTETAEKNMKKFWTSLAESLVDTIAQLCTAAGLHLIMGGQYAAGAALIAAGGLLSVFSGFLASDEDGQKQKDESKRLEKLKDNLAELLKQAKADADYYARALTHNKALSANSDISYQGTNATSVNDMILTPHGTFSTHPDDYLIATKTPGALINSGNGRSVSVNFSMINQSGTQLKVSSSRQKENDDGSFDIEAVVVGIMESKLSDGSMNNAIASGQAYQNGYSVVS